jgi:hypothetical protein
MLLPLTIKSEEFFLMLTEQFMKQIPKQPELSHSHI